MRASFRGSLVFVPCLVLIVCLGKSVCVSGNEVDLVTPLDLTNTGSYDIDCTNRGATYVYPLTSVNLNSRTKYAAANCTFSAEMKIYVGNRAGSWALFENCRFQKLVTIISSGSFGSRVYFKGGSFLHVDGALQLQGTFSDQSEVVLRGVDFRGSVATPITQVARWRSAGSQRERIYYVRASLLFNSARFTSGSTLAFIDTSVYRSVRQYEYGHSFMHEADTAVRSSFVGANFVMFRSSFRSSRNVPGWSVPEFGNQTTLLWFNTTLDYTAKFTTATSPTNITLRFSHGVPMAKRNFTLSAVMKTVSIYAHSLPSDGSVTIDSILLLNQVVHTACSSTSSLVFSKTISIQDSTLLIPSAPSASFSLYGRGRTTDLLINSTVTTEGFFDALNSSGSNSSSPADANVEAITTRSITLQSGRLMDSVVVLPQLQFHGGMYVRSISVESSGVTTQRYPLLDAYGLQQLGIHVHNVSSSESTAGEISLTSVSFIKETTFNITGETSFGKLYMSSVHFQDHPGSTFHIGNDVIFAASLSLDVRVLQLRSRDQLYVASWSSFQNRMEIDMRFLLYSGSPFEFHNIHSPLSTVKLSGFVNNFSVVSSCFKGMLLSGVRSSTHNITVMNSSFGHSGLIFKDTSQLLTGALTSIATSKFYSSSSTTVGEGLVFQSFPLNRSVLVVSECSFEGSTSIHFKPHVDSRGLHTAFIIEEMVRFDLVDNVFDSTEAAPTIEMSMWSAVVLVNTTMRVLRNRITRAAKSSNLFDLSGATFRNDSLLILDVELLTVTSPPLRYSLQVGRVEDSSSFLIYNTAVGGGAPFLAGALTMSYGEDSSTFPIAQDVFLISSVTAPLLEISVSGFSVTATGSAGVTTGTTGANRGFFAMFGGAASSRADVDATLADTGSCSGGGSSNDGTCVVLANSSLQSLNFSNSKFLNTTFAMVNTLFENTTKATGFFLTSCDVKNSHIGFHNVSAGAMKMSKSDFFNSSIVATTSNFIEYEFANLSVLRNGTIVEVLQSHVGRFVVTSCTVESSSFLVDGSFLQSAEAVYSTFGLRHSKLKDTSVLIVASIIYAASPVAESAVFDFVSSTMTGVVVNITQSNITCLSQGTAFISAHGTVWSTNSTLSIANNTINQMLPSTVYATLGKFGHSCRLTLLQLFNKSGLVELEFSHQAKRLPPRVLHVAHLYAPQLRLKVKHYTAMTPSSFLQPNEVDSFNSHMELFLFGDEITDAGVVDAASLVPQTPNSKTTMTADDVDAGSPLHGARAEDGEYMLLNDSLRWIRDSALLASSSTPDTSSLPMGVTVVNVSLRSFTLSGSRMELSDAHFLIADSLFRDGLDATYLDLTNGWFIATRTTFAREAPTYSEYFGLDWDRCDVKNSTVLFTNDVRVLLSGARLSRLKITDQSLVAFSDVSIVTDPATVELPPWGSITEGVAVSSERVSSFLSVVKQQPMFQLFACNFHDESSLLIYNSSLESSFMFMRLSATHFNNGCAFVVKRCWLNSTVQQTDAAFLMDASSAHFHSSVRILNNTILMSRAALDAAPESLHDQRRLVELGTHYANASLVLLDINHLAGTVAARFSNVPTIRRFLHLVDVDTPFVRYEFHGFKDHRVGNAPSSNKVAGDAESAFLITSNYKSAAARLASDADAEIAQDQFDARESSRTQRPRPLLHSSTLAPSSAFGSFGRGIRVVNFSAVSVKIEDGSFEASAVVLRNVKLQLLYTKRNQYLHTAVHVRSCKMTSNTTVVLFNVSASFESAYRNYRLKFLDFEQTKWNGNSSLFVARSSFTHSVTPSDLETVYQPVFISLAFITDVSDITLADLNNASGLVWIEMHPSSKAPLDHAKRVVSVSHVYAPKLFVKMKRLKFAAAPLPSNLGRTTAPIPGDIKLIGDSSVFLSNRLLGGATSESASSDSSPAASGVTASDQLLEAVVYEALFKPNGDPHLRDPSLSAEGGVADVYNTEQTGVPKSPDFMFYLNQEDQASSSSSAASQSSSSGSRTAPSPPTASSPSSVEIRSKVGFFMQLCELRGLAFFIGSWNGAVTDATKKWKSMLVIQNVTFRQSLLEPSSSEPECFFGAYFSQVEVRSGAVLMLANVTVSLTLSKTRAQRNGGVSFAASQIGDADPATSESTSVIVDMIRVVYDGRRGGVDSSQLTESLSLSHVWNARFVLVKKLNLNACGLHYFDFERHDAKVRGVVAVSQLEAPLAKIDINAAPISRTSTTLGGFLLVTDALLNSSGTVNNGIDVHGSPVTRYRNRTSFAGRRSAVGETPSSHGSSASSSSGISPPSSSSNRAMENVTSTFSSSPGSSAAGSSASSDDGPRVASDGTYSDQNGADEDSLRLDPIPNYIALSAADTDALLAAEEARSISLLGAVSRKASAELRPSDLHAPSKSQPESSSPSQQSDDAARGELYATERAGVLVGMVSLESLRLGSTRTTTFAEADLLIFESLFSPVVSSPLLAHSAIDVNAFRFYEDSVLAVANVTVEFHLQGVRPTMDGVDGSRAVDPHEYQRQYALRLRTSTRFESRSDLLFGNVRASVASVDGSFVPLQDSTSTSPEQNQQRLLSPQEQYVVNVTEEKLVLVEIPYFDLLNAGGRLRLLGLSGAVGTIAIDFGSKHNRLPFNAPFRLADIKAPRLSLHLSGWSSLPVTISRSFADNQSPAPFIFSACELMNVTITQFALDGVNMMMLQDSTFNTLYVGQSSFINAASFYLVNMRILTSLHLIAINTYSGVAQLHPTFAIEHSNFDNCVFVEVTLRFTDTKRIRYYPTVTLFNNSFGNIPRSDNARGGVVLRLTEVGSSIKSSFFNVSRCSFLGSHIQLHLGSKTVLALTQSNFSSTTPGFGPLRITAYSTALWKVLVANNTFSAPDPATEALKIDVGDDNAIFYVSLLSNTLRNGTIALISRRTTGRYFSVTDSVFRRPVNTTGHFLDGDVLASSESRGRVELRCNSLAELPSTSNNDSTAGGGSSAARTLINLLSSSNALVEGTSKQEFSPADSTDPSDCSPVGMAQMDCFGNAQRFLPPGTEGATSSLFGGVEYQEKSTCECRGGTFLPGYQCLVGVLAGMTMAKDKILPDALWRLNYIINASGGELIEIDLPPYATPTTELTQSVALPLTGSETVSASINISVSESMNRTESAPSPSVSRTQTPSALTPSGTPWTPQLTPSKSLVPSVSVSRPRTKSNSLTISLPIPPSPPEPERKISTRVEAAVTGGAAAAVVLAAAANPAAAVDVQVLVILGLSPCASRPARQAAEGAKFAVIPLEMGPEAIGELVGFLFLLLLCTSIHLGVVVYITRAKQADVDRELDLRGAVEGPKLKSDFFDEARIVLPLWWPYSKDATIRAMRTARFPTVTLGFTVLLLQGLAFSTCTFLCSSLNSDDVPRTQKAGGLMLSILLGSVVAFMLSSPWLLVLRPPDKRAERIEKEDGTVIVVSTGDDADDGTSTGQGHTDHHKIPHFHTYSAETLSMTNTKIRRFAAKHPHLVRFARFALVAKGYWRPLPFVRIRRVFFDFASQGVMKWFIFVPTTRMFLTALAAALPLPKDTCWVPASVVAVLCGLYSVLIVASAIRTRSSGAFRDPLTNIVQCVNSLMIMVIAVSMATPENDSLQQAAEQCLFIVPLLSTIANIFRLVAKVLESWILAPAEEDVIEAAERKKQNGDSSSSSDDDIEMSVLRRKKDKQQQLLALPLLAASRQDYGDPTADTGVFYSPGDDNGDGADRRKQQKDKKSKLGPDRKPLSAKERKAQQAQEKEQYRQRGQHLLGFSFSSAGSQLAAAEKNKTANPLGHHHRVAPTSDPLNFDSIMTTPPRIDDQSRALTVSARKLKYDDDRHGSPTSAKAPTTDRSRQHHRHHRHNGSFSPSDGRGHHSHQKKQKKIVLSSSDEDDDL